MNISKAKTGRLISERRKALNMTQSELAEKLHISAKAVSKWERAQNFPDVDMLKDLASVLELRIEDLVNGEMISTFTGKNPSKDKESIYSKNNYYMKYLKIMDLCSANEDLKLICILNDYYYSHQIEMDNVYQEMRSFIMTFLNTNNRNCKDIFLSLQNSLQVAKEVITRGLTNYDSIDEAKFDVYSVEYDMTIIMQYDKYDVRKFDPNKRKTYDEIYKYMLVQCDMKHYIEIFKRCDISRAYKRVVTELHSNYFDLIDKFFDEDFIVLNGEYYFIEDYDKFEVIDKFIKSIKAVDNKISAAFNGSEFDDELILHALDKMGFLTALLTKFYDREN